MNKLVKLVIALVIAGGVCAGGVFLYTFYKPHRNVEDEKAVANFDAKAFMQAFETNEADANAKYLDKAVEITGTIGEITANENTFTINLTVEGVDFGGIKCTLDPADASKCSALAPGQQVTLKGQCTGWINDEDLGMKEVSLTRCFIQ